MTGIFESVIDSLYGIIGNYGWTVVLFTLLVRLVLLPLDFKSRKSMRAMSKVQPKVQELQKKYANDKEKLNQKTMELYKKEKVSPMAGCLPMILQLVVLFIMFGAMRNIAEAHTADLLMKVLTPLAENGSIEGVGPVATEGFLWIKNIFQPDSIGAAILPETFAEAKQAIEVAGLSMPVAAEGVDLEALYNAYLIEQYGWVSTNFTSTKILFFNITLPTSFSVMMQYANGLFILPLFAALSQVFMTRITSAQQKSLGDGQQANAMNSGLMKWFFPLFSLYICAGYNSAFAVYWSAANIIAIVQQIVLNLYFEHKDKQAAAELPVSDDI